jgi:biopolymer transport protein TolR
MQYMRRAARMERHHQRHKRSGALNLVSLMDIFTILVFFLLVNSTDVDLLPSARDVQLPESIAEEHPRETVIVLVTEEELLVQGRVVARVDEVMARGENVIPELKAALEAHSERLLRRDDVSDAASREVTIMGDREIPYRLLKKVMATCTDADYGRLSLAVLQRGADGQLAAAALR